MTSRMRTTASQTAYRIGAWKIYHRIMNRDNLTVVMFHRILPSGTPESKNASRTWTVSTRIFEACLQFFVRNYNMVSLAQVAEATTEGAPLPARSLLLTFDDGWADNAIHALPMLEKYNVPSVIFTVAGWVDQPVPWNEIAMRAWEEGCLSSELCKQWWTLAGGGAEGMLSSWDQSKGMHTLLARVAELPDSQRKQLLEMIPEMRRFADSSPVSLHQLRDLHASGVAIESHGLTHLPLPFTKNPEHELRESRSRLAAMLRVENAPIAISFPHGRYDASVLRLARQEGYQLMFTSDGCVNQCDRGRPSALLGRIPIMEQAITNSEGDFRPAELASWLFRRPARRLSEGHVGSAHV